MRGADPPCGSCKPRSPGKRAKGHSPVRNGRPGKHSPRRLTASPPQALMDTRRAPALAAPVGQPAAAVNDLQRAASDASSGLAALSSSPSSAGVQGRGAAGNLQLSSEVDSRNSTACLQRGLSLASGTSDAVSEGQMLLLQQRLNADLDSGSQTPDLHYSAICYRRNSTAFFHCWHSFHAELTLPGGLLAS